MAKTKSKSHRAPPKKTPPSTAINNNDDDDALLDTAAAAIFIGDVSHQYLELGRHKGYGPPYIKVTSRLVRYRKSDLRAYLLSRRTVPQPEGAR
jgi:hypothetical protein